MVVVTLVREGINKHRARELADHFDTPPAAQPEQEQALKKLADLGQEIEQEPTCPECKAVVLYECVACSSNNYPPKPEQEPVAFYHPRKGFYWAKPTSIFAPTVVDVEPMPLYTAPPAAQPPAEWKAINNIIAEYGLQAIAFVAEWKAAQRPWVGLTEEEVQFYIKKHSKLVNAGYDKMTETNLVAKTFDSTGFYKEVSAVLKERNT
jgi:hypothetical protein